MLEQRDIKETLLDYQKKPNTPSGLIDKIIASLSSVQHSKDRGLIIVLDVDASTPTEKIELFESEATKLLQQVFSKEERISIVLTAERQAPTLAQTKKQPEKLLLPHIKNIVAISSGKGGVGKSTVAMNLAVALSRQDFKIGLLDADVLGPSQPLMLGVDKRAAINKKNQIVPLEAHGIKTMSIGYMLEQQGPIIWRGPMVQRALIQMLRDVDWGQLDILILDMPPGTGDIPLTVSQYVPLSGAVIISTPQDIALLDAMKGLEMFEKLSVDILGIVENMSMFACPHCGEETELFGHGGARHEAEKRNVAFLGEIPLTMEIRQSADEGTPVTGKSMDSFNEIAKELLKAMRLK